jgi:hypothetical protein
MKRAASRIRRVTEEPLSDTVLSTASPALLAERQGVAFVATAHGLEHLRLPRRYWSTEMGLVSIPASGEEIRASEIVPPFDAGSWPTVTPRPDLLTPALSRLLSGDHDELSLQPSLDGLRAILITAEGEEQPYPIAPKDALGFASAVFNHAPRGVVTTGLASPERALLSVRPGRGHHEYRLRLVGILSGPKPASLGEIGLSPALLEMVRDSLDRTAAILLISGGPASARSTTLDLMARTLVARERHGGWIGRRSGSLSQIAWLAEALSDWPFPDSLHAAAPDFIVIDRLAGPGDLILAAHLAASGRLVLAAAPAADAESLARAATRELEVGAAPSVPVIVLEQALVRMVCRECRTRTRLPAARARRLGFHRRDVEETERHAGLSVAHGRGCERCSGTGASGLTGIFEYYGPDEGSGTLPRMREEGWRKALQGNVILEDVIALPGAHRPMRTLREILVHAGLSPTTADMPADSPPANLPHRPGAPLDSNVKPLSERESAEKATPAVHEVDELIDLLRSAQNGRAIDDGALRALVASIRARNDALGRLQESLVAFSGFHLSRHSVNTALIALRVASALNLDGDPAEIARCALLHDVGLLRAGVPPDSEIEHASTEESLDPDGCRLQPAPMLQALDCDEPELVEAIVRAQSLLGFEIPSPAARSRADHRSQVVALSSLLDLCCHGRSGPHPFDLHDAASRIIEQHGRRFSPVIIRALLSAVPIFPIGAWVELSSGDLARVISLNEDNHFRPRVELTRAAPGEGAVECRVVDLSRAPFLHIRQRVPGPVVDMRPHR